MIPWPGVGAQDTHPHPCLSLPLSCCAEQLTGLREELEQLSITVLI